MILSAFHRLWNQDSVKNRRSLLKTLSSNVIEVDTDGLDATLNMVRESALEVVTAAVEATRAINDRLKEAEARFAETIDAIPDLIITKDRGGKWKAVNNTFLNNFNVPASDLIGYTNAEIAEKYPQYRETLESGIQSDDDAWELGLPCRVVEQIPHSDGEIHVYSLIKTPTYDDNRFPKELIIIGRDITEQRERDRRMKACFTALNRASDAIVILDESGNIFFDNDKFVSVCAIENSTGQHFTAACPQFPISDFNEMWSVVRTNNQWKGRLDDYYSLSVVPVMNGKPHPIYYICTIKKTPLNSKNNHIKE